MSAPSHIIRQTCLLLPQPTTIALSFQDIVDLIMTAYFSKKQRLLIIRTGYFCVRIKMFCVLQFSLTYRTAEKLAQKGRYDPQ